MSSSNNVITNDFSKLPPLLLELLSTPLASPPARPITLEQLHRGAAYNSGDPSSRFFDNISKEEALQLYSVVRELKPRHSLEIGFCCGGSGMAILGALKDNGGGIHHACDPFQTSYAGKRGLSHVRAAGLEEYLHFEEQFPETFVPSLPSVQFAFIDASHLYDFSILDFVLADKRLEAGGVIAFHDMWMPSLQKVVRYILANRSYETYRAEGASNASRSYRTRIKLAIGGILRMLPQSEQWFAAERLRPWESYGLGNLCFLRKVANDARDWRFHRPF